MISVIIPVYNTASYLENCIRSVMNQTYRDLEIICVDDGSSDSSPDILRALAEEDSRILVITQKNAGVSAARNAGLDAARGDYITFADSDDEVEPDLYETLLKLAKEHGADMAHCGYRRINADGTHKDVGGTGCLLVQTGDEAAGCMLRGEYFVGSLWNKLFGRELVKEVRMDRALKINEDVLFVMQALSRAEKTVFLDVPKYHYFDRTDSSCSRTPSLRKSRDCVAAAEKMLELHRGGELEGLCTRRVCGTLMGLYRVCLLTAPGETRGERKEIQQRMKKLEPLCGELSSRSRLNWKLMRTMPTLYRLTYKIYDRIRKPNWDL